MTERTFWRILWSITEQTHGTWSRFVLYDDQKRKKADHNTYLRRTAWLFEDWCLFRHFWSPRKLYFSSLVVCFFFFVILLVYSFFEEFFKVSFSKWRKQKQRVSLVVMTHDGNCSKDFLQFRHSQVVKNSCYRHFTIFDLGKYPLQNLFSRRSLAYSEIISQTFSNWPRAMLKKFPLTSQGICTL